VIWSSGTLLGAPSGGKGWFRSEASTGALKAAGWDASRSTHQRLPERPVPSANKTMCDKRRVRLLDDDEDEEEEDAADSSSRSRSRTRSYFLKTTPAVSRARSSSGVDSFPPDGEGPDEEEEEAESFWPGVEADTAQEGPLAVALAAARAPGEKGEEDEGVCGAAMCSSLLLGAAAPEPTPPPPRAENEADVEMDLLNEVGLSRPPPPPRPPGWCDRELGCCGAGEARPAPPPPPPPLTALLL